MVLRKSFYIRWSAGRSPRVHEVNPGRDPSEGVKKHDTSFFKQFLYIIFAVDIHVSSILLPERQPWFEQCYFRVIYSKYLGFGVCSFCIGHVWFPKSTKKRK